MRNFLFSAEAVRGVDVSEFVRLCNPTDDVLFFQSSEAPRKFCSRLSLQGGPSSEQHDLFRIRFPSLTSCGFKSLCFQQEDQDRNFGRNNRTAEIILCFCPICGCLILLQSSFESVLLLRKQLAGESVQPEFEREERQT